MNHDGLEAVYKFIKGVKAKDLKKRIGIEDRKRLEEIILQRVKNGKIPCAMCFRIANELGIATKDLIKIITEMKIEITQSHLGCF